MMMQQSVGTTGPRVHPVIRVLVLLTAVLTLLVVVLSGGAEADARPQQTALHVVQSGDTLWSLASRHTPAGGDVWATVEVIKDLNDLEGSGLFAGDQLVVPMRG
jgi:LysM repeat protein